MKCHAAAGVSRRVVRVRAASRGQAPRQPTKDRDRKKRGDLPESGFFSLADPKAEVYVNAKVKGPGDFTKRGSGRYDNDFIWNTNWSEQMDFQEKQEKAQEARRNTPPGQQPGGLSLNRSLDLNNLEVDLGEQLQEASRRQQEQQVQAAAAAAAAAQAASQRALQIPATQAESRRWLRSGRYTKKVVAQTPTAPEELARLEAQQAAEAAEYERLKAELLAWCLATAFLCSVATLSFYSKEVAASYSFGAVGSLIYLRLLNRSVDSVGGFSVGAALGQPRLLIPIILTAAYNRWNTLAAHDTGLTLQLLPMLLGFFTYKAAVIAKTAVSLAAELMPARVEPSDGASPAKETSQPSQQEQTYNQKILTQ